MILAAFALGSILSMPPQVPEVDLVVLGQYGVPSAEVKKLLQVKTTEELKEKAAKLGFNHVTNQGVWYLFPKRFYERNGYVVAGELLDHFSKSGYGSTTVQDLPPKLADEVGQWLLKEKPFRDDPAFANGGNANVYIAPNVDLAIELEDGKTVQINLPTSMLRSNAPRSATSKKPTQPPQKDRRPSMREGYTFWFSSDLSDDSVVTHTGAYNRFLEAHLAKAKKEYQDARAKAFEDFLKNPALKLDPNGQALSDAGPELRHYINQTMASELGMSIGSKLTERLKNAQLRMDKRSGFYLFAQGPPRQGGVPGSDIHAWNLDLLARRRGG